MGDRPKPLPPPLYFFVALAMQPALHWLVPLLDLPGSRWIGVLPIAAGIGLNLVADRSFTGAGTTVKPGLESAALVTRGVFRISRNPMYLGMVLILIGAAIAWGTASPLAPALLFPFVIERRFILLEERMLEETFGDAYREYRSRVRRWI